MNLIHKALTDNSVVKFVEFSISCTLPRVVYLLNEVKELVGEALIDEIKEEGVTYSDPYMYNG